MKEVYKAKIIKKTSDGKIPLEVALMQQVRNLRFTIAVFGSQKNFVVPKCFRIKVKTSSQFISFKVADVPGVIKILDWFESTESFFIVMEKFVGQVNLTHLSSS